MKIILSQDVSDLGKKFEIKNVKPGFAKNFLFPKKLAIPANDQNLKMQEKKSEKEQIEEEKKNKELKKTISRLKDFKLKIYAKTGSKKELFEKITESKIAKLLEKEGFDVKKSDIKLKEPIETIGNFQAKIDFDKNSKLKIEIAVIKKEDEKKS